jgi:hypothetical protein
MEIAGTQTKIALAAVLILGIASEALAKGHGSMVPVQSGRS